MRGRVLRLSIAVLEAALATALAVTITGCSGTAGSESGTTSGGSSEPIRIGAIVSLTGSYAAMGTAEKQALELETERINAAGGIDGREIEIVYEDDATDEAKAVAAASKLIEQENVIAILGATGTGQSMAIRSDVQRAGIPQISMAGGTAITQQFDSLVFQTPWSNTIVVPYVLDAIKATGATKIGVLSDTGGYGKDGLAVIEESVGDAGLTIVDNESFNAGDTDMSAQLTKIKSSGAEAVLLWTAGKEAATIMKNADSLGMITGDAAVPFFGGSGQARIEFPEGAGAASNGFTFGTGKSLIPANWGDGTEEYEVVSDFASRYKDVYGEDPDIFAGHAFDAISIVTAGLKSAGPDTDSAALRDAIEAIDGLAGFGGTFTFSATDHNGLTTEDLALYRFEDGMWVNAQ